MKRGLYVRAGAWATARLAACAISLFGPTTKDSNVFRGLSPGTVVPDRVSTARAGNVSLSAATSSDDACAPVPDGPQNFTERELPSVATIAFCNAGM